MDMKTEAFFISPMTTNGFFVHLSAISHSLLPQKLSIRQEEQLYRNLYVSIAAEKINRRTSTFLSKSTAHSRNILVG
jgi:hypothetical protein